MPISAAPLRFSSGALRQMSNTDINDYISERIGESFASTEGVGSLTTTYDAALQLIGGFTDTRREGDIGDPAYTTFSTERNLYQDLRTATGSATRPLKYGEGVGGIQQMSDTDIDDYISAVVAKYIADGGVGSYSLSFSSPSDGDTWTSRGTLTDITNQSGSYTNSREITLWQKTASSSVTTKRPLKFDSVIKEMTDAEIQSLTYRVRNKIVSSEIGTYVFQENAPVTGTWRQCGDDFTDTLLDTQQVVYTTSATNQYASAYTLTYTIIDPVEYTTTYTSESAVGYTSEYATGYTTEYTKIRSVIYFEYFTAHYTSLYTQLDEVAYTLTFQGYYTNAWTSEWTNIFNNSYTTEYTGIVDTTYAAQYTLEYVFKSYNTQYTHGSYTNAYTVLVNPEYTTSYTTEFNALYTTDYTSPLYTSLYTQQYTAVYTVLDTASYTFDYTGTYAAEYTHISEVVGEYTNVQTTSWTILVYYTQDLNYTGATVVYTGGPYTGGSGTAYTPLEDPPGWALFFYSSIWATPFTGPIPQAYNTTTNYTATWTRLIYYAGFGRNVSYSSVWSSVVSYTGVRPYGVGDVFTSLQGVGYVGFFAAVFGGYTRGPWSGPSWTTVVEQYYTAPIGFYTGPAFTGNYAVVAYTTSPTYTGAPGVYSIENPPGALEFTGIVSYTSQVDVTYTASPYFAELFTSTPFPSGDKYTGPEYTLGIAYTSLYTGVSYTHLTPVGYTSETSPEYTNEFAGTYTNEFATAFANTYTSTYTTEYTTTYTTIANLVYTVAWTGNWTANYTKVWSIFYYTQEYTGTTGSIYTQAYTTDYTVNYTHVGPEAYVGFYSSTYTHQYSNIYTAVYQNTWSGTFTGVFTGLYSQTYLVYYTSSYTQNYTGLYSSLYTQQYTGLYNSLAYTTTYTTSYTKYYTGTAIGSYTTDRVTIRLWVRTA